MKTLIQTLFPNKKKIVRRSSRVMTRAFLADQFTKMAKLGQQLVVMSR